MKKYSYVLTIILMTGFIAIGNKSYAQTETKRADVRQRAQRARIAEGRMDGEVTRKEGAVLNAEQRHIRRAERRAKSDGDVTRNEKRRLERKQNRANRHIKRAKHNGIDSN